MAAQPQTAGSSPEDTHLCCICQERIQSREVLFPTPCNHVFHLACIDPWFDQNRRDCPVCRRVILPPPFNGQSIIRMTSRNLVRVYGPTKADLAGMDETQVLTRILSSIHPSLRLCSLSTEQRLELLEFAYGRSFYDTPPVQPTTREHLLDPIPEAYRARFEHLRADPGVFSLSFHPAPEGTPFENSEVRIIYQLTQSWVDSLDSAYWADYRQRLRAVNASYFLRGWGMKTTNLQAQMYQVYGAVLPWTWQTRTADTLFGDNPEGWVERDDVEALYGRLRVESRAEIGDWVYSSGGFRF